MVLKGKLEISCSSTTFIKEVFANLQWIRSNWITNSRCQLAKAALELRPRARQWPTGHRPWPPRGGLTLVLANQSGQREHLSDMHPPFTPLARLCLLLLALPHRSAVPSSPSTTAAPLQPITANVAPPVDSLWPQLLCHHVHLLESLAPPIEPR